MIEHGRTVAVVGASGAVGSELIGLLADRGVRDQFRVGRATAAAEIERALSAEVTFLCTPADVSRQLAPRAAAAGSLVIDCSSAFRADPDVPLVIPEVNGTDALAHAGIVASPNCSTILLLLGVAPLHRAFGCLRIDTTTYQAVSGAGHAGLAELEATTRAALGRRTEATTVFPEPIAFNVICHESAVDAATGANGEELKIERETRRILDAPELRVTATCARVPVARSHSLSVTLTLARPASESEVRGILGEAPGVTVVDDRASRRFPSALTAAGRDAVFVGRLRPDRSQESGYHMWIAGDQLRKGAALNALQIADLIVGAEALA